METIQSNGRWSGAQLNKSTLEGAIKFHTEIDD